MSDQRVGTSPIPLYNNHVSQLLIIRAMVHHFMYEDDMDHLDSVPYTGEAFMDISLKRQARLKQHLDSVWTMSMPGFATK